MDMNKLTMKSQTALAEAQQQAVARNHQQIEPVHVLFALLGDAEGIVYPLLHHVGANPAQLRAQVEAALEALPKVYTGATAEARISPATARLLETAATEAEALTDEYISTEHLLLAMVASGDHRAAQILLEAGLTRDAILGALAEVRGRQRVTNQNPEDTFQSLEKYGRDLTEAARSGKLDPVIGRDEEIRRTIQVLSRRTKNNPVLIGEPGVGKTAIVEGLAQRIERRLHPGTELRRVRTDMVQQRVDDALGVGEQREQHVLGFDLLVVARHGLSLRLGERGLRLHRQLVHVHGVITSSSLAARDRRASRRTSRSRAVRPRTA